MNLILRTMALTAAVLLSAPANAQGGNAAGRKAGPCASYKQAFCSEVLPGEGRVLACLEQHRPDLSDKCRNMIENIKKSEGMAHKTKTGHKPHAVGTTTVAPQPDTGKHATPPAGENGGQEQKQDSVPWDFDEKHPG